MSLFTKSLELSASIQMCSSSRTWAGLPERRQRWNRAAAARLTKPAVGLWRFH